MLRGRREGIAMTDVFHLYFNNIFDIACGFTFVSFVLFIIFALQVCDDKLKDKEEPVFELCMYIFLIISVGCFIFVNIDLLILGKFNCFYFSSLSENCVGY